MKKKRTIRGASVPLIPRCKVWFNSSKAGGVFGDGKWSLLREIEQRRSIRAAAEALGMSYRKAWGDLKKAEECLGIKLVEKRRGGREGGKTNLTEYGRNLLSAYNRFRFEISKALQSSFTKHMRKVIHDKTL